MAAALRLDRPAMRRLGGRNTRGRCQCDGTNYFDVADVERMIAQPCRKHFLPEGTAGGFQVDVIAVVTDDAIAEIEEAYRGVNYDP